MRPERPYNKTPIGAPLVLKSSTAMELGVNTFLSATQEALKEKFQTFANAELAPLASALETRSVSIRDLLLKLGQSGYLGIAVPGEYGGQGGSFLDFVFWIEAIGRVEPGLALVLAAQQTAIELIKALGSQEQKSRYLPLLARGETLAGTPFFVYEDEPDLELTAAVWNGQRQRLSGQSAWVINGQLAGLFVVPAREQETQSLHLFLLEPNSSIKVLPEKPRLGLCSAYINDLQFDQVEISGESVLAEKLDEQELLGILDVTKVLLSAAALGVLEQSLKDASDYARGSKTISEKQSVQWKLADMSVDDTVSRLQTYRAAWAKDHSPENFRRWAAMCKWLVTSQSRRATSEALQIVGLGGLNNDCSQSRFYRDAEVLEIACGTPDLQKTILVKALGI